MGARREHYSGLKPTKGWQKRNYKFFKDRVFPQLFRAPAGTSKAPNLSPVARGEARVTWIGHASFFIQFHDKTLLIDPVWGRWLGFIKRLKEPGLFLHAMPTVDLVLISHAHADHLHRHTLRQLSSRDGVVVSSGNGELVGGLGFGKIEELSVWEEKTLNGMRVLHTPSHHWGARYGTDTHRDYGGFFIEYDGVKIYHAGDSAYFKGFQEIQEHCPEIDIALLPIGAYEAPSGRDVHMSPEEALKAFIDLKAKVMIPMHYDTYPLGNEAVGEAEQRLVTQAQEQGSAERVKVLEPGEEYFWQP